MINRSLVGSVVFVWDGDPGLDKAHKDYSYAQYLETWDLKHLPVQDGCTLTKFTISKLSRKQHFQTARATTVMEQLTEAIAYGLRDVANLTINGEPISLSFKQSECGQRLTDASLDAIFSIDTELFSSLGTAIFMLNKLSPLKS